MANFSLPKFSLPSLPLDRVRALTRQQRIAICAGTFLVLIGGFYYFMYMPKDSKLRKLKGDYQSLDRKLTAAKAAARDLEIYREEYKKATGELKIALQLLPDKKEIPSLLEGITSSGRRSGLEFLLFQPEAEVAKEFYVEIPVKIEVVGGYHNIAVFFDKLARLPRIVNIFNLNVSRERGKVGRGPLKASYVATTYQFREGAPPKPKKGKGRRR
jgi:type IV pilus assembly protein PilO